MSEPDNGRKIHDFANFSDNIVDYGILGGVSLRTLTDVITVQPQHHIPEFEPHERCDDDDPGFVGI